MHADGRRDFLRSASALAIPALAGCGTGDAGGTPTDDVVAGPGGRLAFEPATLTVTAGDAVTWVFESPGHNLSCRPGDTDLAALPDGATPFATYGPDETPASLVPAGDRFEHTFTVPGAYQYVCVPHAPDGMTGRVVVEP